MEFDIEAEFIKHLRLLKLDPETLDRAEYNERKRSFMEGVSQLMIFLVDMFNSGAPPSAGGRALHSVRNQLEEYWTIQGMTS